MATKSNEDARQSILKLLVDGSVPILKMIFHAKGGRREWKHALHALEYEGKIKRDWEGNYYAL